MKNAKNTSVSSCLGHVARSDSLEITGTRIPSASNRQYSLAVEKLSNSQTRLHQLIIARARWEMTMFLLPWPIAYVSDTRNSYPPMLAARKTEKCKHAMLPLWLYSTVLQNVSEDTLVLPKTLLRMSWSSHKQKNDAHALPCWTCIIFLYCHTHL